MLSATDTEKVGIFLNWQKSIEIKQMLEAIGHQQGVTPVKTDIAIAFHSLPIC